MWEISAPSLQFCCEPKLPHFQGQGRICLENPAGQRVQIFHRIHFSKMPVQAESLSRKEKSLPAIFQSYDMEVNSSHFKGKKLMSK